ncbi:hypothetical protein M413DRAFT_32456 [Hebeloma cylindrosporum]|uniref:Uncharacterized protein n=1 Tax=Hebeloma cylindrosporum TaxID=76867 RepID=A0A0C3BTV1_HEBCY|nr:hypothetical protein M413DRAFT_32456 [Hebeloma cylindrosporum h7]
MPTIPTQISAVHVRPPSNKDETSSFLKRVALSRRHGRLNGGNAANPRIERVEAWIHRVGSRFASRPDLPQPSSNARPHQLMSVPSVSAASTDTTVSTNTTVSADTTVPTLHIPPEIISKIIDDLENMYFNQPRCEYMVCQYMVFDPGYYGVQLGHFLACRLVSQTFMDIITPRWSVVCDTPAPVHYQDLRADHVPYRRYKRMFVVVVTAIHCIPRIVRASDQLRTYDNRSGLSIW